MASFKKSIHSATLSKTLNCGALALGTGAFFFVLHASRGKREAGVKEL